MKAFPTDRLGVIEKNRGVGSICLNESQQDGMDLRDYFAAKALQGLIAGCYAGNNAGFTVEGNVFAAYEYADEMMKARSNHGNG